MKTRHAIRLSLVLLALVAIVRPAAAFDAEQTFAKGTKAVSVEGGYGWQFNLEGFDDWSRLEFWNVGVRASLLPFGTTGAKGKPLHGALEIGLEPFYQQYTEPRQAEDAFWAGLAAVFRYHFISTSLGRFVPYVEIAAAAGGTDLEVREIKSDFSFLLWGGLGASVFLTDSTALYAGWRWEHNSNGNIESPNRGWESSVAVVGVSYYFR